jgi:predicted nucleic acid-binding protein
MISVIDTSALVRLYIPDGPLPEGIETALQEAEKGIGSMIAPELIIAEAAQVLLKKARQKIISNQEASRLLESILALPLKLFSHQPLITRAFEVANACAITIYDALFLTLAEQQSAQLITADKTLEKAQKWLL